ncbi:MAG TPA: hypothetical protein VMB74_15380 [Streptosporangiaceae bacterium]|nr:hypothetical protein [Streptosporangiaceae bacterium]
MANHVMTRADRMCLHSAGRSQMALGWFTRLAGDRAIAWSGAAH